MGSDTGSSAALLHAGSGAAGFGAALASASNLPTAASSDQSLASATARNAVETVVKLADAQSARTEISPSAVNLGFKFGDDHLSVRVEVRSGQVHTQFTTSSPELREALTAQFAAMTSGTNSGSSNSGGNSDRQYQFAQPEFAGSNSDSDQRGARQDAQQAPKESFLSGFGSALASPDSISPSDSALTPAEVAGSALHLQAFA